MSVLNLKLNHKFDGSWIAINKLDNGLFFIELESPENEIARTVIDRGQAHLLMLYLQEHLK